MKLYKKSDSISMPWKNGQGMTEQIEIFPENSVFPGTDFLWRLSSAIVQEASPFSQFPGCDRWLMVLKGQGLLLDGAPLFPEEPIQFSGEASIHCALLGGEVTDIGLIFRRDKICAEMLVEKFSESHQLALPGGIHFIFCCEDSLRVADQTLEKGDSLGIQGPANILIQPSLSGSLKYIRICIQEKLD